MMTIDSFKESCRSVPFSKYLPEYVFDGLVTDIYLQVLSNLLSESNASLRFHDRAVNYLRGKKVHLIVLGETFCRTTQVSLDSLGVLESDSASSDSASSDSASSDSASSDSALIRLIAEGIANLSSSNSRHYNKVYSDELDNLPADAKAVFTKANEEAKVIRSVRHKLSRRKQ